MQTLPFEPPVRPACVLERHAVVEVPLSEIQALRDVPVPVGAPALPPRFLRHCDEQTVVGVRAVLEALACESAAPRSLARDGVIAAPRLAGRITAAQTLAQVATAGDVAVSPHVVPQCSLHALASAVSVALGMHGPNFGTSGGPEALSEGLFTALSLVQTAGCDRLWLVLTEWDEEPVLDAAGRPGNDPLCRALALALAPCTAAEPVGIGLTLRSATQRGCEPAAASGPGPGLAAFTAALALAGDGGVIASWSHICPWGAEIRITAPAAVAVAAPPHVRREAA
ncbi:MAG: hypothetical protein EBS56_05265 [Planctomycetia bacterium]|nr:hypothetical protein [Planctomycetia bacterium]